MDDRDGPAKLSLAAGCNSKPKTAASEMDRQKLAGLLAGWLVSSAGWLVGRYLVGWVRMVGRDKYLEVGDG